MPSLDEIAMVRLAARRTEQQLARIHAAMTLLYVQMGAVTLPVHEEVDSWVRVIEWLADIVAGLESNLQQSLQHDELEVMAKRVRHPGEVAP